MKQEINENDFRDAFRQSNRDNFSYEGYTALYNYYDEFEDYDLDIVAIDCEVTEYDEEELFKDFKYLLDFEEFKEENKDIYENEEEFKEEYIQELIKELEQRTTIIKLDNNNLLVWEF